PTVSYQRVMAGTLIGLPAQAVRKVGMTSSHHGPYAWGCTRATMDGTMGCYSATRCQSVKAVLSSDRSLQLDSVKSESLVIAYQLRRGEYVPGPCTHRPSSHGSRGHPKPVTRPGLVPEGAVEGELGDWG